MEPKLHITWHFFCSALEETNFIGTPDGKKSDMVLHAKLYMNQKNLQLMILELIYKKRADKCIR